MVERLEARMDRRMLIPFGAVGVVLCGLSQGANAQVETQVTEEAYIARDSKPQGRSAIEVLRSHGFDVKGIKANDTRKVTSAAVTGFAVSTRTAIVNEWVHFTGLTSNIGTAEPPLYPGSTDVCVRVARFDSPVSFNPTWIPPVAAHMDGVVETYRIDTSQLYGVRTLDVEMAGAFTMAGGTPGGACATDGCGTTYTFNDPDIIGLLCEIWAGSDGTSFSRVGYCNQTDILPSVWNQGLRSKTDTLPPYDGGASTAAFRSRNTVNAGLGTYYRIRFGYFSFGGETAYSSRVCDSILSVTND
jgi:hypothetical protein